MLRHRNELPVEGELPGFSEGTAWLNSAPRTSDDMRGRVVLVCFGTYTCINWIRTLPYMRAWADRYATHGLEVIGVQTPEFEFERDLDNVRRALGELDVRYPIVVDNDYAVWQAFDNHYWPALYFVDARGRLRHHHFGEGDYEASEMVIQMLLREAGGDVEPGLVRLQPSGVELAADWANVGSPESYVGYERAVGFASLDGLEADERHSYEAPAALRRNQWSLSGEWRVGAVPAHLDAAGGSLAYQFHARDLNLVMGPPRGHPAVRFQVHIDGEPPGASHGIDVDSSGAGTADYQRMYQLIRQPGAIGDRRFEIEFSDAGVEAFVFTFG